ncbi:MAG: DUF4402 domain-containing protein [Novosphingobium sp.]
MVASAPAAAQESCAICLGGSAAKPGEQPLTIEIASGLVFSRMALTGGDGGSAAIDPQSGQRSLNGGLVGLGGIAVQGRGRITGAPGKSVRVELPGRVAMSTGHGGAAELTDIVTDLPSYPVLDANGTLEFSFGGTLRVTGAASGKLRGRIPISVEYN